MDNSTSSIVINPINIKISSKSSTINENEHFKDNKIKVPDIFRILTESNINEVQTHSLIIDSKHNINLKQDCGEIYKESRKIVEYKIDLLKLYKFSLLNFFGWELHKNNTLIYSFPAPNYYFMWGMTDFVKESEPRLFLISNEEIIRFRKFWKLWPDTFEKLDVAIQRAILFHRYSFHFPHIINKFLNLILALESLYLKGIEKGELTYKLSHRASMIIGNSFNDEKADEYIFEFIKHCYDFRSTILHGEKLGDMTELNKFATKNDCFYSTDIYDLWRKLELYTRISIQFFRRNSKLLSKDKEYQQIYSNPVKLEKEVKSFYKDNKIIVE